MALLSDGDRVVAVFDLPAGRESGDEFMLTAEVKVHRDDGWDSIVWHSARPQTGAAAEHTPFTGRALGDATPLGYEWTGPVGTHLVVEAPGELIAGSEGGHQWSVEIVVMVPNLGTGEVAIASAECEPAPFPAPEVAQTSSEPTTTTTSSGPSSTTTPPTTTSTPAGTAGMTLVGTTDPDPDLSMVAPHRPPHRFTTRVVGTAPQVVADYPVAQRGCGSGQSHVTWRSLGP